MHFLNRYEQPKSRLGLKKTEIGSSKQLKEEQID